MKNLRIHLQYKWGAYLAIALATILIWMSIFSALATVAANSRLYVAFFGDRYDTESAQIALEDKLPDYTNQEIKEFSFVIPYLQDGYGTQLAMYTHTMEYDLVIVSERYMYNTIGMDYFVELPTSALSEISAEVYYEDGKAYGFVVSDGKCNNNFTAYCSGNEMCYVFITLGTQNAYAVNDKGDVTNDAAIAAI